MSFWGRSFLLLYSRAKRLTFYVGSGLNISISNCAFASQYLLLRGGQWRGIIILGWGRQQAKRPSAEPGCPHKTHTATAKLDAEAFNGLLYISTGISHLCYLSHVTSIVSNIFQVVANLPMCAPPA